LESLPPEYNFPSRLIFLQCRQNVKAQLQQQKLLGFSSLFGFVVVFLQSDQDLEAELEQKQQKLALLNQSLRSRTCFGVRSPTSFAGIIYGAGRFDAEVGDLGVRN